MHSCFFSGKEKESVTFFTKNSWTHIVPQLVRKAQGRAALSRAPCSAGLCAGLGPAAKW
jgi:hypothetical protein